MSVTCIECEAVVTLTEDAVVGEVIECPDCGIELEVTNLDPLTVELAPELEEDWGE